jgi:hypothetical protein
MLVKVLSFGSNWWRRSRIERDPGRCVYYNSTGIRCGKKIRRHWIVPGILRLNGVSNFDPAKPFRCLGAAFESDLSYGFGGNRLLLKSRVAGCVEPHFYLIAVSSGVYGRMNFQSGAWRSVLTHIVASSELRGLQEALLLMHAGDWFQTARGFWQLHLPTQGRTSACLLCLRSPSQSGDQL